MIYISIFIIYIITISALSWFLSRPKVEKLTPYEKWADIYGCPSPAAMSISEWVSRQTPLPSKIVVFSNPTRGTPYLQNYIDMLENDDVKKVVVKKGFSPDFTTSAIIKQTCCSCKTVHYGIHDACKICGHELTEETEQEFKERLLESESIYLGEDKGYYTQLIEKGKPITEKHNHAAIAMGVQCGNSGQIDRIIKEYPEYFSQNLGKPFKPKDQK
jgi:hypothetical protein